MKDYGDKGTSLATQPAQQEPVAFSQFLSDVVTAAGLLSHGKTDKSLAARISEFAFRLRTPPQPAQQEPVATLWQHGETGRTRITMPGDITDCDARWFKAADLYTSTPAQRQPLSGWIAVSDRIPLESAGEVLVRMRDGRCEIAWATYWHGASNAFAQWTFRDPDEDEAPTHWMPIPAIEAAHGIKENT